MMMRRRGSVVLVSRRGKLCWAKTISVVVYRFWSHLREFWANLRFETRAPLPRGSRATPLGKLGGDDDDDVYPRETPPHIRTARASPQRHTAAGTAAPTTADTGNTVPQRANPTQTAYAHPHGPTEHKCAAIILKGQKKAFQVPKKAFQVPKKAFQVPKKAFQVPELSLAALLWALCVLLQMRLFVSYDDMIG